MFSATPSLGLFVFSCVHYYRACETKFDKYFWSILVPLTSVVPLSHSMILMNEWRKTDGEICAFFIAARCLNVVRLNEALGNISK